MRRTALPGNEAPHPERLLTGTAGGSRKREMRGNADAGWRLTTSPYGNDRSAVPRFEMTLLPRGTRLVGIRGTRQGCGREGSGSRSRGAIDRSRLQTAAPRNNHVTVRATLAREPGQAFAEMAVIVAAIAVARLLAALFLGVTIKGLFDRSGSNPATPPVFTPPATTPAPVKHARAVRKRRVAELPSVFGTNAVQ